jgi:centromere protein C
VNAGVSNNKSAARQNGKSRLVATEAAEFSDGEGEGDENADAFAPGEDDFSDGYTEGDETVMPLEEENADATAQNLSEPEDEVSPAPAASRQTKTTASSSKEPKKGPAAKATKATKAAAKATGKRRHNTKPQQAAENEEPVEARPTKKPKTTATEPLDPELDRVVENYAQRSGPLKGRSLYILKREDPSASETTHTRSGRVSVRPLAYWRNERCVYGDGEAVEGQRYPLSTIKEVIRTEELEPDRPKKGKRGRKGKSKKQKDESSDEDEIDDDADLWEKETGVLHGYVSKWDPVTQTSTSEEEIIGMIFMSGCCYRFAINQVMQILRTHRQASRQGKSKEHHSASQNFSALPLLVLVSLSFHQMVSKSPRIRRECTWCSMSVMAEYKSTFAVCNSVQAKDPCSKFHEVSSF